MMTKNAYFWYRLFRTDGIGPKRLAAVQRELEREGLDPNAVPLNKSALEKRYPRLAKIIVDKVKANDKDEIRREYEALEAASVSVIYPGHPHYPPTLTAHAEQFGVSPVLLSKGQTALLIAPGVAIVGSRAVSESGVKAARQIASDLARSGFNVVSGYAKGIDTEAHRGALEVEGTTTMVLSYGILRFKQKRNLAAFRFDQDCVAVSQLPPREPWRARNAMARNKLVSTLSRAVVVVQSGPEKDSEGKMSGTFDAGRLALKMRCLLFVVSPKCFERPPAGNAKLIELGGISIDPSNGASTIIGRVKEVEEISGCNSRGDRVVVQGSLFDPPMKRGS